MTLSEIEAKLKFEQAKLNILVNKYNDLQNAAIIKQSKIVDQLLNLQNSYKR